MTTPHARWTLAQEFRRLAAEADSKLVGSPPPFIEGTHIGTARAFDVAAQMLEERLNGNV